MCDNVLCTAQKQVKEGMIMRKSRQLVNLAFGATETDQAEAAESAQTTECSAVLEQQWLFGTLHALVLIMGAQNGGARLVQGIRWRRRFRSRLVCL